jgi:LacI family transcriptional regulator
MRVTLSKIAKETGYSVAAISQVLNNHPNAKTMRQETRDKILAAVKRLGYKRNENAAQMRTGVCRTVALVLDFDALDRDNSGSRILSGVLMAAAEESYGVKVYDSARMEHNLDEIQRSAIDYVISFVFDKNILQQLGAFCQTHKLALCSLQEGGNDDYPVIYSDDREGIRRLVHYFHGNGHRRIALVTPARDINFAVQRSAGYLDGMRELKLEVNDETVSSRHEMSDNQRDIERMLAMPEEKRPTAFICSDDMRAMLVINQAFKQGINIPEECAVSGFGNTISANLIIPVSSVAQPFREIGVAGLKTVIGKPDRRIEREHNQFLMPVRFVERDSTKFNRSGG